MAPTVIYVKQVIVKPLFDIMSLFSYFRAEIFKLKSPSHFQVLDIIGKGGVKGIAHITGGGFTDNIPRVFPEGLGAVIYKDSWNVPSVFKWIQQVESPFICKY